VALLRASIDLGRLPEARETFALLGDRKRAAMERAAAALVELATRIRADQGLPPAEPAQLIDGIDFAKLPEADGRKWRWLQSRALADPRTFAFLEGSLLAAERRYAEALSAIDRAADAPTSLQPDVRLTRAGILLAMRRAADAAREFTAVLDIDPLNAAARFGLARAACMQGDFTTAATEARAAIGCRLQFPRAHLLAGFALWRSGRVHEAEAFLRTAVRQEPVFPAGHRVLAAYLAGVHRDLPGAIEHRRLAAESRRLMREWQAGVRPAGRHVAEVRASLGQPTPSLPRPTFTASTAECVIVVTGLPRSGTSMMMQMLAAGGVSVLADDRRLADESNPRGYLEYEPVKRLCADGSWLGEAVGRAVKIVSPLVQHLPRGDSTRKYCVVAMHRPITEIVSSQRTMLARSGKPGAHVSDAALASILERHATTTRTFLAHLEASGRARVLDVAYHDALADPARIAVRIANFLGPLADGRSFDSVAATATVDASLHHERRA